MTLKHAGHRSHLLGAQDRSHTAGHERNRSHLTAGWRVRPIVLLGYHSASIPQRVYLTCNLDLNEYVHRWLGEDFAYVGGHHCD